MLSLRIASSSEWLSTVLGDFDSFLLDHASCERKASATAMTLVSHHADRTELVDAMIELAREELQHFQQVYRHIAARGLSLVKDERDLYVRALRKNIRHGRDDYFLDRLLVAGIVEARGCERFGLIAEALPPGELKDFYADITRSEARHHGLFLRLARIYFDETQVDARLDELLEIEGALLPTLPLRPALH